jgi:uncharacterized membrane protein YgdD (TMEM256/DUF423 family)
MPPPSDNLKVMNFPVAGAILLALAVALGAFGAHSLKSRFDEYLMGIWEKAVFYHFIHALGLLVIALAERAGALAPSSSGTVCWLLVAGIVLFSGSLYALALSGITLLGAITPAGGVSFIAAWVLLAVRLSR